MTVKYIILICIELCFCINSVLCNHLNDPIVQKNATYHNHKNSVTTLRGKTTNSNSGLSEDNDMFNNNSVIIKSNCLLTTLNRKNVLKSNDTPNIFTNGRANMKKIKSLKSKQSKINYKTKVKNKRTKQISEKFKSSESDKESVSKNRLKNNKKRKTAKKSVSNEVNLNSNPSESESSADIKSDDVIPFLKDDEQFVDFSELAKMKSMNLDQDSVTSQHNIYSVYKENPLLNWTCSPLSLEEEQNISTGYLDNRIANVIENAQDYPEGGTQLIEDMQVLFCYLKHVNQLVIDKVKRGKMLMKELVEDDPKFTQIRFDTDDLTDHFSWVEEEAEAFEKIMDGICYQWKCLVARYTQKRRL